MAETVILAYSGGLDTSYLVPWLKRERGADVVTVTVDVGGLDAEGRKKLEERSLALGAARHLFVDARATFWDEVLRFLVMGNVLRGELYPLCVGAERTLQAREVARAARELKASVIAHGCTAAGNDQVRFEVALRALAPEVEILAPIRDMAPSREEEVAELEKLGFPPPSGSGEYSINSGLWGVTIGGSETGGSRESIPESAWERTRGAFEHPPAPSQHSLCFEKGIPCALDGEALDPVSLIERLDVLAASYGIGRGVHMGETVLGMKGRVAFEAPAPTVILSAHRELEKLVLTGRQIRVKDQVARAYGDLVHEGQHLDPACRDIEALFVKSQERVSGEVFFTLRSGSLFVTGCDSPHSLMKASASVYGERPGEWTPADARGFSRIVGIPAALHQRAQSMEAES